MIILSNPSPFYEGIVRNVLLYQTFLTPEYLGILHFLFSVFGQPKSFITDFPIEISPLARRNDENPQIADRFELFIGGKEISNGFSELNDPLDQLERFRAQVAAKNAGDEEAQHMDEDYVWALGHGMPPTAGEGIGLDRLVMLLTNNRSIKDVILFPALKVTKSEYTILKDNEQ